jgi:endoribonuclease Dicer
MVAKRNGEKGKQRSYNCDVLCRENVKQNNLISAILRSEKSMVETALSRDSEDLLPGFFPVEEKNEYLVGTTGAKVTAGSSISVIVQYCDKLPGDKYGDHIF